MLVPLHNNVVLKLIPAATHSPGGIALPDASQEKPRKGTVVSAGPGSYVATEVKEGQVAIYMKYAGTDIAIDGEEFLILKETDILAVEV